MRIPFSYRQQSFAPILLSSLLGHVLFLGGAGFLIHAPEFSVRQAPSSVDIVIDKEINPPIQEVEKVFTADPRTDAEETIEAPDAMKPRRTVSKPIVASSEEKGALEEAKPIPVVNESPLYPNYARERGWHGLVLLEVLVSENGEPLFVQIVRSSGYRILDSAAQSAVSRWKFSPAKMSGLSLRATVKIPIRFVLENS